MSELRAQVAEVIPARTYARVYTVRDAFEGLADDPLARVNLTEANKTHRIMRDVRPGGQHPVTFANKRLAWHKPSQTITGSGGAAAYHYWHPSEHRPLTTHELKRICSFPDGYRMLGSIGDKWARLGNSVPPLLMRAIASGILRSIGQSPRTCSMGQSYVETLNDGWAQHLAPREEHAPTVVSTFAGCGGSSLGYSMAGYRELLAVEWDDHAAAMFALNFPEVPLYHGDIKDLTVDRCLELAGIAPGELDVFDGSPPCQGFSTAGKRVLEDPRNGLFREYVRLLDGLRPKVFVMENVSGMVKGKMKLVFAEILRELKGCGYRVSARLLNAMYFGVPQSRERMIFVGIREDLDIDPTHPEAQSAQKTIRQALIGVADDAVPKLCPKSHRMAPLIRPGECQADHDPGKGFQNLVRPHWDKPSPTLAKLNPGHGFGTMLHPIEHRAMSIAEAKRLGSFPDAYRLEGPFKDRWARIGNSVPPLLMRAIAGHIRESILAPVGIQG